jgi:hypothetical protein
MAIAVLMLVEIGLPLNDKHRIGSDGFILILRRTG